MEESAICPDCKAIVPKIEGVLHPYFGANAGCWKLYGQILEKEYSDPSYMKIHRLTVDAYAAQHPGKNEARAAQSVNIHLMGLYLIFEKQTSFEFVRSALSKIVEKKNHKFEWLPPPQFLGALTILDVLDAKNHIEHSQKVTQWAQSVWKAWHPYRKEIENLAKEIL